MSRAFTILVILCALLTCMASAQPVKLDQPTNRLERTGSPKVDLVYFGATDCPFCRKWELQDLPKLMRYKTFSHVRFTKIEKAVTSGIPPIQVFPPEIRHLHAQIAAKLDGAGSPMFALATEGKVVATWRGATRTPQEIEQMIYEIIADERR